MTKVLIDACGWVAAVESGINFDHALSEQVGPFEPVLLPKVREELQAVQDMRSKPLLLELLGDRSDSVETPEGFEHTDDQLVAVAMERTWPVLTIDRELKQRLADARCSFIEVVGGRTLRLIEF